MHKSIKNNNKKRGRFAPSPTGALHLGNARTFLLTWLSIKIQSGELILRIEDLDHPKVKPGTIKEAVDDLIWLGLTWNEGYGIEQKQLNPPYIQSQRTDIYAKHLSNLIEKKLVYPCTCSRKEIEATQSAPHAGESPKYPGTCKNKFQSWEEAYNALPDSRIPIWRFKSSNESISFVDGFMGEQSFNNSELFGDFAIARHQQGAGYMLAVVVDDALMNISEVVRGSDLLDSTPRQLEIYKALQLHPPEFIHVPLVVAPDGRRLAKRHGDTRISTLRKIGNSPEKIIGLLAYWCGWAEFGEEMPANELLKRFSWNTLNPENVILTNEIKKYLNIQD
ncbi:MAG: tRNA glutamyl-Q(34) synthetase GluQRS [Kiritimatiellae bacterium]|jgi:glutamyl-tRNA synthetase|nr:tRNA glutamyl-Q(34) synthetase GluQRS [Kiritimatiellia bacterium]